MAHIEHRDRLIHRNLDFFFLHDDLPIRVQHGEPGVGVQLLFLNLLFVRGGCNDLDAVFALVDVAFKLIPPFVEAGNQRGVRFLHVDQHGIVDAVTMEPAHRLKVLLIFLGFKQLFDSGFDAVGYFFEPFFVAFLLFRHDDSFPGHGPLNGFPHRNKYPVRKQMLIFLFGAEAAGGLQFSRFH